MADTSDDGRDIPLSWQIEFEPADERLEKANRAIEVLEIEPDGYGWVKLIDAAFTKDRRITASLPVISILATQKLPLVSSRWNRRALARLSWK
jgi:hypothetical protein